MHDLWVTQLLNTSIQPTIVYTIVLLHNYFSHKQLFAYDACLASKQMCILAHLLCTSEQSYTQPKNLKNKANSKTTIAQNTRGCCLKNCLDCVAKVYTGIPYAETLSSLRMFAGLILLA